jgi:hypothetical protein
MEGLPVFNLIINAFQALPELPLASSKSSSRTALTLQAAQPVSAPPASDIPRMQKPGQLQEPL